MKVYRLSRAVFTNHLSGTGSSIKGARWNSAGVEMIYTAESRALAMAEVMVHLSAAMVPDDYLMITVNIPDDLIIKQLSLDSLAPDWNVFPYLSSTQSIGDGFIRENKFPAFRVPSAVVPGDFNLLLNPHHADFSRITVEKIEPFLFNSRIFHSS
jgi:RES domain-containing protein